MLSVIRRVFLLGLLLLLLPGAQATPIVLKVLPEGLLLDNQGEFLIDHSGDLNINTALASGDWKARTSAKGFGFIGHPVWLRYRITIPEASHQEWLLESNNTLIESVQVYYQAQPEQPWQMQEAGRVVPHSQWPFNTSAPVFRIDLPPGEHLLVLRLHTRNSLSTRLLIWERESYNEASRYESLINGWYFGSYVLMILFQYFFWLITRDRFTKYYIPYTITVFLITLTQAGIPANTFDISSTIATNYVGLVLCAGLYFGARFSRSILNLAQHYPRLDYCYRVTIPAVCALSVLAILCGVYWLGAGTVQLLTLLWIIVSLAISARLSLKGNLDATFYLLAFVLFDIGVFVRFLRNLGLISPNLVSDYNLGLTAIVHTLLMSLLIFYRFSLQQKTLEFEQKARREQGDFIAMIAHEFRTPLAIINTTIQQLASNPQQPEARFSARCQNIRNASQRLSRLINDFLLTERFEKGHDMVIFEPYSPSALLQDCMAEFPEARFELAASALPEILYGDFALLKVALYNLLANAQYHAQPESTILLQVEDTPNLLVLRICNEGLPIPPEELPRLFEKYFRGREARNRTGAGLGLYLTRKIVGLHHGSVTASSEAGLTCFKVCLDKQLGTEAQGST
jgi:signal transduction histidine kinase